MVFIRWESKRTDRSGVRSIMDSEFTTRVHPVQTIFQTLPGGDSQSLGTPPSF
jgi:hypothetical protein